MSPARSRRAACSASTAPKPQRKAIRVRTYRWLLLAVVVLGLSPGTFLRSEIGTRGDVAVVSVVPVPERSGVSGELTLTGAWELTSSHGWFGGFSALVAGEDAALIAGTDRGWLLDLDLSGDAPRAVPGSYRFVGERTRGRKEVVDLESLARDPATGTLWAGYEGNNTIARYVPGAQTAWSAPPAMKNWSANSGPETMLRLTDGRFMVLAEGAVDGSDTVHEGLLFPGDPVQGARPFAFRFITPPDYDPVDATQVPDGRVLILLRRVEYALPARFDTAIAIADPRGITPGAAWPARVIQRLNGGVFADNFEGLAFVPSADDPAQGSLWVIADDNFSMFQRSLLARFDWNPQAGPLAP
ncbi:MAG: esterase-like activity of phytase family protein [Porphyrobacter sp. IPPAS B-1204]|nr:MAG: esterase-like activity of phytase family protein [Porphyrobacter sp. IPPAS B-1204]